MLNTADTKTHRGVGKTGIIRGNNNVTGPGQHQTAGNTFTLYSGDGRLGDITPVIRVGVIT